MPQDRRGIGDIISTLTVTVLFVVILCLVVFAARGYQHSVEVQDSNGDVRAVVAYVANSVRDNNTGNVTIEDRSGVQCLVISSNDGYEQKFYMSDGSLYEEYGEPGSDINPDSALKIGDTDRFDLELDEDGLLQIRTDIGSASVNTSH